MRLKANFPNPENTLWPGEFVNVAGAACAPGTRVLVIPSAAVQRGPTGLFAYVVKADGTVEMRPVKVGERERGLSVVEGGLRTGSGS